MEIKLTIEQGKIQLNFWVEKETGMLKIQSEGLTVEIPNITALELISVLRSKLMDYQEANDSLIKRIPKRTICRANRNRRQGNRPT